MKTKKIESDVDFIGGQEPLTKEEEKALSEFFSKRKLTAKKPLMDKTRKTLKRNRLLPYHEEKHWA